MLCPPSSLLISPLFTLFFAGRSLGTCVRGGSRCIVSLSTAAVPVVSSGPSSSPSQFSSKIDCARNLVAWPSEGSRISHSPSGLENSAGRRHIGCVDVVYVRERGILGAAGGGEGGWSILGNKKNGGSS